MGKAYKVRRVHQYGGAKTLFRLDPPVKVSIYDKDTKDFVPREYDHVISSSTDEYVTETTIFPANERGEVIIWEELWSANGLVSDEYIFSRRNYEIIY